MSKSTDFYISVRGEGFEPAGSDQSNSSRQLGEVGDGDHRRTSSHRARSYRASRQPWKIATVAVVVLLLSMKQAESDNRDAKLGLRGKTTRTFVVGVVTYCFTLTVNLL